MSTLFSQDSSIKLEIVFCERNKKADKDLERKEEMYLEY